MLVDGAALGLPDERFGDVSSSARYCQLAIGRKGPSGGRAGPAQFGNELRQLLARCHVKEGCSVGVGSRFPGGQDGARVLTEGYRTNPLVFELLRAQLAA